MLPCWRRRPLWCPFVFEIVTGGLLEGHGVHGSISMSSVRWCAEGSLPPIDSQRGPYWMKVFTTTVPERTLGFLLLERVCVHVCVLTDGISRLLAGMKVCSLQG